MVPVPLALATNRLSEALAAHPSADPCWPPLLQQPRFRSLLLEQLLALP